MNQKIEKLEEIMSLLILVLSLLLVLEILEIKVVQNLKYCALRVSWNNFHKSTVMDIKIKR